MLVSDRRREPDSAVGKDIIVNGFLCIGEFQVNFRRKIWVGLELQVLATKSIHGRLPRLAHPCAFVEDGLECGCKERLG